MHFICIIIFSVSIIFWNNLFIFVIPSIFLVICLHLNLCIYLAQDWNHSVCCSILSRTFLNYLFFESFLCFWVCSISFSIFYILFYCSSIFIYYSLSGFIWFLTYCFAFVIAPTIFFGFLYLLLKFPSQLYVLQPLFHPIGC